MRRIIGTILFVGGLGTLAVLAIFTVQPHSQLIFSSRSMLGALWHDYKARFVEADTGRTVDPARDYASTSEGQAYTMLRAVWMDDKITFDQTWKWTKANLLRPDGTLSWLYGRGSDGSWGIRTDQGGQNTASDADVDAALALAFAYARWQQPEYIASAQKIISGIWNTEVFAANGQPVLAADNLEKTSTAPDALVNPSYFAPYAYRIFARLDQSHDWNALIDSSYRILAQSASANLDTGRSAGLLPDWISVNKATGGIKPAFLPDTSSNFGYEALRSPWRLALDFKWSGDPRASQVLSRLDFISEEWRLRKKIFATYKHDGSVAGAYENPAMYGGSLGYFLVEKPDEAAQIYEDKLAVLFSSDLLAWKKPLSYYDSNWAWFGLALYNGALYDFSPYLPAPVAGAATSNIAKK